MYYALGIDPDMEIRNHLNQPRELVKGKIVWLFAYGPRNGGEGGIRSLTAHLKQASY
jgi:hypothetical protein